VERSDETPIREDRRRRPKKGTIDYEYAAFSDEEVDYIRRTVMTMA